MIAIVVADPSHMVRQGMRALLETETGFSVVGEAADGLEAVEAAERLHPDVLIMEAAMPGLNGLEAAREVHGRAPETRVLILSTQRNETYVLTALKNGAHGYILKDETASALVQAVRDVNAGRRYLSPPLSERIIQAYIESAEPVTLGSYETLTAREREVLQLTAEGHTNADIAARLSISPRTAETHRSNLMRKLGLRNLADLIRYALRCNILPIDH